MPSTPSPLPIKNSQRHADIDLLRCLLILLLVTYHSFCPYTGNWKAIEGYDYVGLYHVIGALFYSFFLEMFVFISGFLYGEQVKKKGNPSSVKEVAIKKGKRLLIPSVVFSIAYIFLFHRNTLDIKSLYTVINGAGHMWFLPMLFWCFIGTYFIDKYSRKLVLVISGVAIVSVLAFPLPFRLGNTLMYLIYFLAGYLVSSNNICLSRSRKKYICGILVFIICFCINFITRTNACISWLIFNRVVHLIGSCCVIYVLFSYFNSKFGNSKLPSYINEFACACFGIYLIQQFVLQFLYYHTALPQHIHQLTLPWAAALITIIVSYLTVKILIKTKIGKFLLG